MHGDQAPETQSPVITGPEEKCLPLPEPAPPAATNPVVAEPVASPSPAGNGRSEPAEVSERVVAVVAVTDATAVAGGVGVVQAIGPTSVGVGGGVGVVDASGSTSSAGDAVPASAGAVPTAAAPAGPPKEEVPWLIIWTAIAVVLGAAAAIELVVALQRLIELLVIAGFLAVVLSPAVAGLVRLHMRRGLATTLVFVLGMMAFGGLGYLFIHPLYQQASHLASDLPGTLARVQAGKGRIGKIVARYHLQNDAAKYIPKIKTYLSHLGGPALSAAKTVLSGLGSLVVLLIMTFLLLLEGPATVKAGLRVLPERYSRRARRIMNDIARSVTGYVVGNFATSVIAGAVIGTTLLILQVPFAIVFGVWVALVDLLPLVGGLLAGVPTVAFAFLYSPTAGIVTVIVFLVYQQVENHLLNPVIMSRTVNLNPLWVLLSVLAGAELLGIVGALLAIPAAGTIHVIARDIWDERRGRLKVQPTVGPEEKPIT
jgi:predicted PurR-regulated permease PerM